MVNPLTQPRWLLHSEGAALLAVTIVAYAAIGGAWWLFALLFFAPDLFALGYVVNARFGAACYNFIHTVTIPAVLLGVGYFVHVPVITAIALIILAHIGFDRLAGFGLKYPTRFQDTHLQHV